MATIEFKPGTTELTDRSKELLRTLFQAQELSRFLNRPGNYMPNPEGPGPGPWPWPIGPWARDPYLQPNILYGDLLLDSISKADGNKNSFSVIDAIKREKIAQEAFQDLSKRLDMAQQSVKLRLEQLG